MENVIPFYFFDTAGDPGAVDKYKREEFESGKGKKLRCRSCEHIITEDSKRISIENSHSHNRINPAGFEYHIQCFSFAPGCTPFGEATSEYTWFSGYRWQVAVCNSCSEHLGWYFRGETSFYGLITIRLVEEDDRLN